MKLQKKVSGFQLKIPNSLICQYAGRLCFRRISHIILINIFKKNCKTDPWLRETEYFLSANFVKFRVLSVDYPLILSCLREIVGKIFLQLPLPIQQVTLPQACYHSLLSLKPFFLTFLFIIFNLESLLKRLSNERTN